MIKYILGFILVMSGVFAIADSFSVTIDSQQVVSVTTTSTKFLTGNAHRTYVLIQNNGTANIIATFGAAGSQGVIIAAGGNYEPYKGIIDDIYLKSVSGTQSVTIIEGH